MLTGVFLFCLVFGGVWLLLAAFLGDILGGGDADVGDHDFDIGDHDVDLGGGHDIDVGGHDVDAGGHDIGGDVGVGDAMHLGPFSPLILACFLATFGASGLIFGKMLPTRILDILVILPAAGVGVITSGGLVYGFNRLSSKLEGSSELLTSQLPGYSAQVITPIPANGKGKISLVARGTRFNWSARSLDGIAIPKGAKVIVDEVRQNLLIVSLHPDEKMKRLGD